MAAHSLEVIPVFDQTYAPDSAWKQFDLAVLSVAGIFRMKKTENSQFCALDRIGIGD
jgi:hypothetical protein